MDEEYICFMCLKKYEYEANWSDDEAIKEYEDKFPEATKADMTLVCDDCYQEFMKG